MGLVFSIAFNGYDHLWEGCIASHEQYAARHGYEYQLIGRGSETPLAMEVAWLKIPLLVAAIDRGHDWIMFIDSDAAFDAECPAFDVVQQPGKDVYLANGHSGRPNSGVIILRNSASARNFLIQTLELIGRRLPRQHQVGWGENGAVIHVSSRSPTRALIDPRWNNNHTPGMKSHIYHYSAGPMRDEYERLRQTSAISEAVGSGHQKSSGQAVGSPEFIRGLSRLLQDSTAGSDLFDVSEVSRLLARMEKRSPSLLAWMRGVLRQ